MTESLKDLFEDQDLLYVNDDDLRIKRIKRGKGFIYVNSKGGIIRKKELILRFKSLVIPPAWENVLICDNKKGHIQAVGRDKRGRKQYIYHKKWEEFSNTNKFSRLIEFGESLPIIRRQVEKDLQKRSLLRNKILAVIIRLLEETLIRIGNKIYAEQNKSFGLTTLKNRHIKIKGTTLNFHFNGKGGKPFDLTISNKGLSKIVKKCQDLPGQYLFQYIDEEGNCQPIESSDVNSYLNNIIEKNFTAKDFRTWGATILAAENLNQFPLENDDKINERNIVKAVKLTSKELNNTPSVCRKYYIHPDIIKAYRTSYLSKVFSSASIPRNNKYGLDKVEKVVLKILKKYSR